MGEIIYVVAIYETPYMYEVKADNKEAAEALALIKHNGGSLKTVLKIEAMAKRNRIDGSNGGNGSNTGNTGNTGPNDKRK